METRQRPSHHRHAGRHPEESQFSVARDNKDDDRNGFGRRRLMPTLSRSSKAFLGTSLIVIGVLILLPRSQYTHWTSPAVALEEMSSIPQSLTNARELSNRIEQDKPAGTDSSQKLHLRTPTHDTGTSKHTTSNLSQLSQQLQPNGSLAPVVIRHNESSTQFWQPPTSWKKEVLMQRVGHYIQYIKDLTVQPYTNAQGEYCVVTGTQLVQHMQQDVLFFTNNQENEPFMKELRKDFRIPSILQHIDGFEVFSVMATNHSHSFHKHGESWLGQVEGRRQWWFLPPTTQPAPERVNSCWYLNGKAKVPSDTITFIQHPGDVVWFPKDWYHATCALDEWTVGIGWQQGPAIRQAFPQLNANKNSIVSKVDECLPQLQQQSTLTTKPTTTTKTTSQPKARADDESAPKDKSHPEWKWFDGDLNAYYNSLTTDENHKRDPSDVSSYAVHRWLGHPQNTEEHYQLMFRAMERHLGLSRMSASPFRVLDAGCGLGAGLMWMEQNAPVHWNLTGYTISEEQHKYITQTLPPHRFQARLQSFDDLDGSWNVIYSIEALIHSEDMAATLREWNSHLTPGGVIVLIDDFLAPDVNQTGDDIQDFAKSWLANSLVSIPELSSMAQSMGMELVEDLDLVEKYKIIEINYKNKKPAIQPFGGRNHQGWMGSKWRQRLTVEGKLTYDLVVLQKKVDFYDVSNTGSSREKTLLTDDTCESIPKKQSHEEGYKASIIPQLMSGKGDNGGQPISCISGWYCCNKGEEWYQSMTHNRTEKKVDYLLLDQSLFGHYMEVFARHLNDHYRTYPVNGTNGRFLDIGGTGSTASGMQQVTSKFQNFVGPLKYWKLDSDPAAKQLEHTVYCDIDDCPAAETCGFDVTFSHTVLEHARRPWLAFDEIARITKSGGLTMHLVPWSYQYHATPGDHFRFSHTALQTLLEDRGFEVLEVGYDICTKQENKKKAVDEHYDVIWLSYVVGRKR